MKPALPWPPWKQKTTGLDLDAAGGGRCDWAVCLTDILSFRIAGRCQEMSTLLEKSDEPGKYTACESLTCDGFTQPSTSSDPFEATVATPGCPWPEKPPFLQFL